MAEEGGKPPADPSLWIYLSIAVVLVLLGGAFAGLTIALMGQDEVNLQVIQVSGEGAEKSHAGKVLALLSRGKHWVLVTLLLGNVITNETLPIVLDRSLGGGWPAVLGSTVLIVIFGEIIPQSVCVRHGLAIGSWMSNLVLILMYILGPVAWPTAKLLDRILGEESGTVYKKAGLKTLVDLHKTLGTSPDERLNQDEVTIISAVLDLKEKSVGSIMTPIQDVFTMSSDTVLDEKTMDVILSAGYSRIPIHDPENNQNFVGMLLVKVLITYDPEDGKRVSDFALATLPETRPETSCLDIINFFQEGRSHMLIISEAPGTDRGVLGVVTLEDVIEELIGEEIIDESDVFVDVHKAIRRMAPAPKARVPKGEIVTSPPPDDGTTDNTLVDVSDGIDTKQPSRHASVVDESDKAKKVSNGDHGPGPQMTLQLRRHSSAGGPITGAPTVVRGNTPEMRQHLKHLGPSNLASRPRATRYNTVKIKSAAGGRSVDESIRADQAKPSDGVDRKVSVASTSGQGSGIGGGLVNSAGQDAKDGVLALQASYGTFSSPKKQTTSKAVQADGGSGTQDVGPASARTGSSQRADSQQSQSTLGSLRKNDSRSRSPKDTKKGSARSGSITENVIVAGGVRKVVLETTSSSEEHPGPTGSHDGAGDDDGKKDGDEGDATGEGKKKRRRRRRRHGAGKKGDDGGENAPLLGDHPEE
ncbi:MAG: hypothetical protein M1817_003115 [Caeruleum heppii]|nr:MAG: hypothetical protein M1817_003115 [Caeruleum heppii]